MVFLRHQTLHCWNRARSELSGFFGSLLQTNIFIIKKENLPDVRSLMFAMLAWKRLKWFRWESYLFQGQSPENILADWEKVAICSLLYFHEMNDASKKRNSDDIWGANGILFKVGTFLLSVFNFCGYKDKDLFINDYLAQCLENVCILLVQHTNLLWWFWENPRLFKSGNRWSSKLNCISQSGHVFLSASLFSLYVSCLLSS